MFAADEAPALTPAPDEVFDIPTWTHPKVAPDRHVQIAKALYSVPGELVGRRLDARVDARTVKLYWRGELIKLHPVMAPGRRHTDAADLPTEVSAYAMPGALRAAALDHELGDHSVEDELVVEPVARELAEVGDGLRRVVVVELERDRPGVGVEDRRRHWAPLY